MENLQILVTASINRGLSVKEINNAVKSLEKSGLLRELNLKINIDKNLSNSLSSLSSALNQIIKTTNEFNNIGNKTAQSSKQVANNIDKETAAYNKQTQELQKNAEIRKRITTGQDNSQRTSTTTGTKFNNTTTSQTITPTGKGNNDVIDHPVVQVINTGALKEAEKALQAFTSDGSKRVDELSKHFGDANKRVSSLKSSLSNLTVNSSKTDFDTIAKKLKNLENVQKSQLGDLNTGQKEAQKLANQIADSRIKSQNDYSALQAKQQREIVNNAQAEANLMNKQFEQKKTYLKNSELVEAQAHKDNLKRNTILGDARITDQKLASSLAARQNREFDQSVLNQTKNYTDWWSKALKTRDNQEVSKLVASQKRAEKESNDYSKFWGKSLIERDQKEQRFYESQNKRLTDNKVASANILDDKRSTYLTGQYDKVIQKMQQMQSAGKVLTESDTAGINTRIQRLDNYRKAQVQIEQRTSKLNSIIASSEKTAASFSGKFGNEKYESSGIGSLITQLKQLDPASKNAIEQANVLKNKISQLGAEANGTAGKALSFGKALSTAMVKFPIWMLATTAFYAPLHALQSGIGIIAELDAAMTNLKKVTDETNTTYSRFLENANSIANSIANTTTNVVKSTTEWARLGYSIQQAQSLAEQTLVYQNVGDIKNAEDASQSLISAIKGFGIEVDSEGKNITKIVDIYNEVGNKFAISSAGIGEAMRRSASSMFEAGNTIEEAVALATAANSTIQDPARVGQMLKTVSMRLRGVSEEGEDLTNLIPTLEKKFQAMGLTLKKDDNTFKNTYEIFQDLASVWDKLTDMQRADVLESVAGKLQGNLAASLINNFKDAQNSLTTALNSTGSAARENATYIDSIAGRVALFKNSVEEFWAKSIDSSVIKGIIDLGTELISVMGNLGNVVLVATGLFIAFKFKAIMSMVQSLGAAIVALTSTSVAMNTAAIGTQGLTVAMITLQSAIPIALAVGAVTAFIIAMRNSTQATEVNIETIEEANKKYEDLTYKLKDTEEYYKKNFEAIQDNTDIKDKLFELQNQLIDTYGKEAKGLDLVNGKYEDQLSNLKKLKETQLNTEISETQVRVNAANEKKYHSPFVGETFKSMIGDVPGLGRVTDKNFTVLGDDGVGDLKVKQYYEELLKLKQAITDKDLETLGIAKNITMTSEDWQKIQNAVKDKIAEISPLIEDQNNLLDKQKEKVKNDTFTLIAPTTKLNDDQLKFFESLNTITSNQSLKDYSNNLQGVIFWVSKLKSDKSNISEVINGIKEFSQIKGNPDLIKSLNQFMEQSIEASQAAEQMTTLKDAMIALDKGIGGSTSHMDAFIKIVADSKDEIDLLNKAQAELKENNFLSSATVKEMSEKYENFIKVTGLSTDAIYKFITAKKEEKIAVVKAEIEKTETSIRETKKRIEALTDELNASIALLDVNSIDSANTEKLGLKALQAAKQVLGELTTKYGILKSTLTDFNTDTTKTDNDKLNDSYSDTVEILTDLQKALKEVQRLQDEEENKRKRMRQSSKEYQDSLKKTIDLKKQELALLEKGAKDPSQLVSTKVQTTVKSSDETPVATTSNSSSSSSGTKYSDLINKYASLNGVDPNLITAIIKNESSFNTNATSGAGAQGLMQLMPGTAKGLGVKNSYDPEQNIAGGTKHFARLVKKYKGDIELALYAYNAGEGNVDKWIKNGQINNIPFSETKAYAPKVLSTYNSYSGNNTISTSSTGVTTDKTDNTTVKTSAPTSSEIQKAAEQNTQDIITKQNEIYESQVQYLESIKYIADSSVEEQERLITASQKRQEKLDPTSAEFKKENQIQVNIQSKIQSIKNQESLDLQKAIKDYGIESDEYDKLIKQLQTERMDIQSDKYKKLVENINIGIDATKDGIANIDNLLEQSQIKMAQYAQGTPEYNKELNYQIELKKKQRKENDELISSLEGLVESENLDAATKKNLRSILDELKLKDYTAEIKDLNNTLIASKSFPLEQKLSDLNDQLDISEAKMKSYVEESKEYKDEVKNQLTILNDKIAVTKELITYEDTQSRNEELSASAREEHKNKLKEYTLSLYEYKDAIKSLQESYADKIIEDYKKLLQEQQKLQKAAYEKEKELENDRYENRIKNLDDELAAFQDVINAQSKSLDREVAGEDYTKQLADLQKEKSELEAKFSSKLLDDSLEGKASRADLQKEIDAKAEEIAKLQRDREITIRKDGLSDQLEDRQNAIEKEKKLEDAKHDAFVKNIENLEKINDDYYEGLLNDEQYFYNMKQSLMSGDTVRIQNELNIVQAAYDTFFKQLEANSAGYAAKIKENLKYSIGLDEDYAKNFPVSSGNGNTSGGSNNTTPDTGTVKTQKQIDWEVYLSNKQKAEQLKTDMKTLMTDSADYKNKQSQFNQLKATNDALRAKYTDFPDGTYEELKNIKKYHTGGEVGVEGTTTQKWWNKISKNGEVPAILKRNEIVLDQPHSFINEIANNAASNARNLATQIASSQVNNNSSVQQTPINYNNTIRIDKVIGTEEGAKTVAKTISDVLDYRRKQGK